jgi:ketosteroid isomerase-like protein
VEIVQAAFLAFGKDDMKGVLGLCDENIEITFMREEEALEAVGLASL